MRHHKNWKVSLFTLTAAAAGVSLLPAAAHAQLTYITSFGSQGSGNGQLTDPAGVALGPDGTVYVTDTNNSRCEAFTAGGTFLDVFGASPPGAVGNANGLAVSALGTVYVPAGGSVVTFNSTGTYLGSFGTGGSGNGQFGDATAAAFGPAGTLYVTDAGSNNRVEQFTSTGVFLNAFGSSGTGQGQLNFPFGIAVSPTGNVYVADDNNSRIEEYTSTGVSEGTLANTGSGNGQVSKPGGLAESLTGTLYVADYGNNRIDTFGPDGTFLASLGTTGSGSGQFFGPSGVAVSPNGSVYVVNTGNNRIDRFFDPSAWVAGTQSFTNIFQGPINVGVGPTPASDILGTSLTLNPLMTLNCFGLSVDVGGTFTQAGGTLSVSSNPPGLGVAGNFIYQSGTFGASGLTLTSSGTFQAIQGGALTIFTQVADGGQMALDGGVVLTGVGSNPVTLTVSSGGLLTLGNAKITLTGAVTNSGEIDLNNNSGSVITAASIQNNGLLDGTGRINAPVVNGTAGSIAVNLGQSLLITGAGNTNAGMINLAGGNLHYTQGLNSSSTGVINGYGTLRVDGGLVNSGSIALAGSASVFGNVTNNASGTIRLTGNQPNVFFNAVANSGTLTVDAGASGSFFGPYSGNGPITNNGALFIHAGSVGGVVTGGGSLTVGFTGAPTQFELLPNLATSTQSAVNISTGSTLDISNNGLKLNFGSPAADPSSTIVPELISGRSGGTWTGTGITSSSAASNPNKFAVGYADGNVDNNTPATANQFMVEYTLSGDATLDGKVGFDDLLVIAQEYGKSGQDWAHGNLVYDPTGLVGFSDLLLVAQQYGQSTPVATGAGGGLSLSPAWQVAQAQAPIPEPGSVGVIIAGTAGILTRRRRWL